MGARSRFPGNGVVLGRGTAYNAARAAALTAASYGRPLVAKASRALLKAGVRRLTGISPMPTSNQHDQAGRYHYRRMPARRRKRWVRFTKRVRHVDLQMQPLQIYAKTSHASGSTLAGQGNIYGYMCGGVTVTGNDEIYQMFRGAYNVASVAECAPYKLYMKSLVMDMQLMNTGTTGVIFDVYRVRCTKAYSSASTLAAQWLAAIAEVAADSTTGTITNTEPALTLFDAPNFLSFWKVLSKREFVVGAGNVCTLQIRKPVNRYIDGKQLATCPQALPGFTEAFVVTWHGMPNSTPSYAATTVTVSTNIVGHYAIPPGKTKEAGRSA